MEKKKYQKESKGRKTSLENPAVLHSKLWQKKSFPDHKLRRKKKKKKRTLHSLTSTLLAITQNSIIETLTICTERQKERKRER